MDLKPESLVQRPVSCIKVANHQQSVLIILWTKVVEFPLAPMGVLGPGSGTHDPPLGPPSTLADIFRRTCLAGGGKIV